MSNENNNSTFRKILQSIETLRDQMGRPWARYTGEGRTWTVELDQRKTETRTALGRLMSPDTSPAELDKLIQALAQRAATAPVTEVFVRVGHADGAIVLDRGSDDLQFIRITQDGWSLTNETTVAFRRPAGMLTLPRPSEEHTDLLSELAPFCGDMSRPDRILIASFLIGAMNPQIPQPVLELVGTQGSGKSTTARVVRTCIDPNAAPSRRVSNKERDIFIGAANNWMHSLENLSSIQPWLSDVLCSIATGSGFATRRNYSDDEEVIFQVRRPVIVNAIHSVILRPDLRDRALSIVLPEISSRKRRTESEFWNEFAESRPRILGALLDCASVALAAGEWINPKELPRMADWYRWILAAAEDSASTGFKPSEFEQAHRANRASAHQIAIDASPIGRCLFSFVEDKDGRWTGTLSDLLLCLSSAVMAPDRPQDWPRTPEALRHAIDRIRQDLAAVGLRIEYRRETSKIRQRQIALILGEGQK